MPKKKTNSKMIGYKGFDEDWQCRGKQYAVGKSYEHEGTPKLCSEGLHFCENPLDLFGYYDPASGHFAEVEAEGVTDETETDSKRVAKKLKVKAELTLINVIQLGVKFILEKVDFDNAKETNTGNQSAATNTGDRSAATNTGNQSAATNTGDQSAATNTGNWSAATNTGYQSAATNTGNWSAAASIDDNEEGVAISLGIEPKAKATKGCYLVLAEWAKDKEDKWHRIDVQSVFVDGEQIKEGTFYTLRDGKFVEVK